MKVKRQAGATFNLAFNLAARRDKDAALLTDTDGEIKPTARDRSLLKSAHEDTTGHTAARAAHAPRR